MTKLSLFLALGLAAGVAASGVAGKWTLTVDTGPAHGVTTMGLTLTGDALRLSTIGSDEMSVTFHAKMREDGTLAGYLSTPRGDMKFTAERAR